MSSAAGRCVVLGAGGHASSVDDVVRSAGWEIVCFGGDSRSELSAPCVDHESAMRTARAEGLPILVAIGDNARRASLYASIREPDWVEAIVASSATVADSALVGRGTTVHHHAHIGPNARVGTMAIINTRAVVEHDCRVGDGTHVAPGAMLLGGVEVGVGALIGAGATVLPGLKIGNDTVVGAHALVTRDVEDGSTVVGSPATSTRTRSI
ncbi:acetyltransferase [Agromyces sp. LHK192]|uniref:acetyltransferase n=1 Tax=Agromyces sp. LHK192 TaxID=2498704 RepID=UPI000FD9A718|nr:acetyltransferase [Agromyces sp. LHK192]